MRLTATVTVMPHLEAGHVYEGAIVERKEIGSFHSFLYYNPKRHDWFEEPIHRFVPLGEYLVEGVPRSGAQ
jgi:hypothetical protein